MQMIDKYKIINLLTVLALSMTPFMHAQAETTVEAEAVPLLSHDELVQLAGPVALYPDDLLAIVLPASTYPLQIVAAARFRADESNDDAEPDPDWDESIVALLNYPEALALLNEDINWTWQLGQAVIEQEQALMSAVQDVRQQAYAAGNIDTDDKQTVYVDNEAVVIEPAEKEIIYVPYYDPVEVVVHQPRRVYHYYPRSYPVYYYPYRSYNRYYDDYKFWGLTSFFTLSWSNFHLAHYRHSHRHHRYYGRHYAKRHFYRTNDYRSPRYHNRRWSYRHGIDGRWRPAHRFAGHRQLFQNQRHVVHRPLRDQRHSVHRAKLAPRGERIHTHRTGRHHFRSLEQNRRTALAPRDNFRPRAQNRERRQDVRQDRRRAAQELAENRAIGVRRQAVNERTNTRTIRAQENRRAQERRARDTRPQRVTQQSRFGRADDSRIRRENRTPRQVRQTRENRPQRVNAPRREVRTNNRVARDTRPQRQVRQNPRVVRENRPQRQVRQDRRVTRETRPQRQAQRPQRQVQRRAAPSQRASKLPRQANQRQNNQRSSRFNRGHREVN